MEPEKEGNQADDEQDDYDNHDAIGNKKGEPKEAEDQTEDEDGNKDGEVSELSPLLRWYLLKIVSKD